MSEFINENPNVLDMTQLPSRAEDVDYNYLREDISDLTKERKTLLLKIGASDTSVLSEIELLDRMLYQRNVIQENLPSLAGSDVETETEDDEMKEDEEGIDAQEIYDLIAHISDPEHPFTLGQLSIVILDDIEVFDSGDKNEMAEVVIRITPTITHCSLATLIGLGIRVRLERSLPPRFKITILLKKGSHQSENQVNKQLNDKERVAAACENDQLLGVVSKMLSTCK